GLAAAALYVEAEAPRVVAARPRLGHLREEVANDREQTGIGGRVGARGASDGRLVDLGDTLEVLQAVDAVALGGILRGAVVQPCGGVAVERVVDQGRLARSRY